jgi:recombination protein RecA
MAGDKKEKKKKGGGDLAKKATGSRFEKMAHVADGARKVYSSSIMHSGDDLRVTVVPRVSTGSYGLDAATNGGYPIGRITQVYGEESSGKTTDLLRGLGNFQKLCANCYQPGEFEDGIIELPDLEKGGLKKVRTQVIKGCPCGNPRDAIALWNDAENVWLASWAKQLGAWPEKVILLKPSYGEQAYDVVSAFVEIQEVDLIVIDSIAALTPAAEFEASMEEQQQGAAARMNNKFIRKVVSGMCKAFNDNRPITMWTVNQFRMKIGVLFGNPETLPGGMGQKFMTSLEIEKRKGKVTLDDLNEPIEGIFKWKVVKNKVGVAGAKGEFTQQMMQMDLFDVGDLLEHDYVIDRAVELGFIEKPNNVMFHFDDQKFRGRSVLTLHFAKNPQVYEELKTDMLRLKLGLDDG